MYDESGYADLWNDMDEMLIRFPELSELWLDKDRLAILRSRYPQEKLNDYFRKRAFTALVMEKIFRIYEATQEAGDGDTGGDSEEETITLANPDLQRIWEDDVKDEYSDYPEFIEYVARNVFS